MCETLAIGYSSESTQRELSNEYQHDRVGMVFKSFSILVLWTKVASALEGLRCGLKFRQYTGLYLLKARNPFRFHVFLRARFLFNLVLIFFLYVILKVTLRIK